MPAPDVQFHMVPVVFEQEGLLAPPEHGFTLSACVLKPRSRGMVAITTPDPTGKPFDANLHQGMGEQASDAHPPGTVLQAYTPAWTLNGRLLRPAMVVVRNATLGWSRSALTRLTVLSAVRELNDRVGPVIDQDADLLPLACEALLPAPVEVERRIRWENPTRLARRLFWLLDDLDARQAELLLQRTPPAAMWILRNGFSGGYNRSSYLMWVGGGTGPAV